MLEMLERIFKSDDTETGSFEEQLSRVDPELFRKTEDLYISLGIIAAEDRIPLPPDRTRSEAKQADNGE